MNKWIIRVSLALVLIGSAAFAFTQLRQAIKIIGVTAAVREFGPEMNRALNRLVKHKDSDDQFTKVVPIITIGLNTRGAIGAAQVKGAKRNVEQVQAVAAPEAQLFGREIMIRGLIPISENKATKVDDLKAVNGVGVSGIVDLRL